jgi:hypothetical protein
MLVRKRRLEDAPKPLADELGDFLLARNFVVEPCTALFNLLGGIAPALDVELNQACAFARETRGVGLATFLQESEQMRSEADSAILIASGLVTERAYDDHLANVQRDDDDFLRDSDDSDATDVDEPDEPARDPPQPTTPPEPSPPTGEPTPPPYDALRAEVASIVRRALYAMLHGTPQSDEVRAAAEATSLALQSERHLPLAHAYDLRTAGGAPYFARDATSYCAPMGRHGDLAAAMRRIVLHACALALSAFNEGGDQLVGADRATIEQALELFQRMHAALAEASAQFESPTRSMEDVFARFYDFAVRLGFLDPSLVIQPTTERATIVELHAKLGGSSTDTARPALDLLRAIESSGFHGGGPRYREGDPRRDDPVQYLLEAVRAASRFGAYALLQRAMVGRERRASGPTAFPDPDRAEAL